MSLGSLPLVVIGGEGTLDGSRAHSVTDRAMVASQQLITVSIALYTLDGKSWNRFGIETEAVLSRKSAWGAPDPVFPNPVFPLFTSLNEGL